MRTLYYVNAGASWFGFYLDEGALALANDGARFNSFGAVLAWPVSTISSSLPNASRKDRRASRLRCAGTEVEYEGS
jgi:hypothetical protein